MKGLLNLRGISGQIAALVVVSIVALHLIITASFLLHRPDQPEPSSDRGHGQLAASVQLLGAAPPAALPLPCGCSAPPPPRNGRGCPPTSRAPFRSSASRSSPQDRCLRRTKPAGSTRTACSGASAMTIASSSLRAAKLASSASAYRTA